MAKGRLQLRLTPEALAELERRAGGKDKRQAYIEYLLTTPDPRRPGPIFNDDVEVGLLRTDLQTAKELLDELLGETRNLDSTSRGRKLLVRIHGFIHGDFPASPDVQTDSTTIHNTAFSVHDDERGEVEKLLNDPAREDSFVTKWTKVIKETPRAGKPRRKRKAKLAESVGDAVKGKASE